MATDFYTDILEPKQDPDASAKLLAEVVAPIYQEYWNAGPRKEYDNRPFELQAQQFFSLWFTSAAKIFVTRRRDTDEVIGFLIGIAFRPMLYSGFAFQVEDWYARGDKAVEHDLFDTMQNALRFIGCDELRVEQPFDNSLIHPEWTASGKFTKERFTRAE